MDAAHLGLRLASGAFVPLVRKLFRQEPPGAELVDRPVRISALVSFTGEHRTLDERDLEKLARELVERAVRAAGPHDAPSAGERTAVAGALARTLHGLGELGMDDVQAVRLGHRGLARELLRHRPPGAYDLSPDARHWFDSLLETACLHILNFFTRRSAFVARTLVEQSRQLDRLVTGVDLLIERMPARSALDASFEEKYARYVIGKHSLLTIYGIDLDHAREWPLDAAYLSLEAVERQPQVPPSRERGDEEDLAPVPQPAETALAGRERVLLRGVAGSGKTTLVQWLAVTTARGQAGPGTAHLLGRVPFVLPMRTLTRGGRPLPVPDGFLPAVGCPHSAPAGWVERVLSGGRGLLLIDGIDEIPPSEREHTRRWLRELMSAFPGNLWLVTARPSAVPEDWLAAEGFAELSLTQMSRDDVAAFIQRWHRAARVDGAYEAKLLDAVRTKADLGRLATNPLMCGLICALHRERRGYLPRGRKALYDAALLMLLERRDRERDMGRPTGIELDAEEQAQLLQKLAYWLIRNGRSEMVEDIAIGLLARVLPAMPHIGGQGRPEAVYRHLLDRSGLLREPAPGTVDFVHRTFQDYLGAREAVEEQDFPMLVDHAHLDQWEDVLRMAVAHGRPEERARLLRGLVERGDREPGHRIRLDLVAMACLEHATRLDPAVRELVERRASRFLPPRALGEAEALAALGPVVLDLLPDPEGLTDTEAWAVVVTAGRIATDAALPKLARFARHEGPGVRNQLAWAWKRFDTERYAREVMRHLPRDASWYPVARTREELRVYREMLHAPYLHVLGGFGAAEIAGALEGKGVTQLNIRDNGRLEDLEFLESLPELRTLRLLDCPGITGLEPVASHPQLRSLRLEGLPGLSSLRPLDAMPRLSALHVRLAQELELPRRAPLRDLEPPPSASLTSLTAWPRLWHLALHRHPAPPGPEEWAAVGKLPVLRSLALGPAQLRALEEMPRPMPAVTHLYLHAEDVPLTPVARLFPGLSHLGVARCRETDLAPLADLRELRSVSVDGGRAVRNAECLTGVDVRLAPRSRY
ncbi:NACHT domain-containing protein [Streptomyces sodiiphilus]|uniref:NACHT domain-containing protein n=1 Tax=Streptomyces sodiiphilus TaxID=226217 RepID=A0ABN2PQ34_9ACTN